jgi:hypothetical protein
MSLLTYDHIFMNVNAFISYTALHSWIPSIPMADISRIASALFSGYRRWHKSSVTLWLNTICKKKNYIIIQLQVDCNAMADAL